MRKKAEQGSYGQFCPVAMAAEILCSRWTLLIVREFLNGTRRFNDLRRGVPRMSPTLLSKRLKELREAGIIVERRDGKADVEYQLTAAGEALRDVVMSVGIWGHSWIESSVSLKNLDPTFLMWDMRRNLRCEPMPARRCNVQFAFREVKGRAWWLVIENGTVDLCSVDPGHDVDLYVNASLRSMTAAWMGLAPLKDEIAAGDIVLTGDREIADSIHLWLGLNPLAPIVRNVA